MDAIPDNYSATVKAHLIVGGQRLAIAKVGPSRCILRDMIDIPPTDAEIILSIDGDEQTWPVFLTNGVSRTSDVVLYRDRPV
jgi:hypothetical protein